MLRGVCPDRSRWRAFVALIRLSLETRGLRRGGGTREQREREDGDGIDRWQQMEDKVGRRRSGERCEQ